MTPEEATARTWAEIDLDSLRKNLESARGEMRPGVELIAVLKADAYGLGARPVARALWGWGVKRFAVATLEEALELRRALPESGLLVLGWVSEGLMERAVRAQVGLTLFRLDQAEALERAAARLGRCAPVQVKVDVGLHRLGFDPGEAAAAAVRIARMPHLRLEGLYGHLGLRDEADDRAQAGRLDAVRRALAGAGVDPGLIHLVDSIGMVRYPEYQLDAVRSGAYLAGNSPSRYAHPERVHPVLTLKTRIVQLRWVEAGERVGYDEDHPLARRSRIATLCAGYADGYPRLNSVGQVAVAGCRVPVVGLVCMDQMMVDVSGVPEVREGDEVTLLGGSIRVEELAAWGGLNRNEALCRVGRRVPRVYLQGGRVVEIAGGWSEDDA